jgi:hypothetical protein
MELTVTSSPDDSSDLRSKKSTALAEYQIPPPPYVLNIDDFCACILTHVNLDIPDLAKMFEDAYNTSPFHLAELWGRMQGLHALPVDQYSGFAHKMHSQENIHEMFLYFVAQVGAYMKCKIPKQLAMDGFRLYEKWAYLNYIKIHGAPKERHSTHHYYGSDAYLEQKKKQQEELQKKHQERQAESQTVVP